MGDCVFVIGDIHGCFHTLLHLLDRIGFKRGAHRLILVGDLVNRGAHSLAVLRWAVEHQDSLQVVLGNHDLHLLALAAGATRLRGGDRLTELLEAPDCADLLAWLRRRPLVVRERDRLVVHAGLWPGWSMAQAEALAREVEAELTGDGAGALLAGLEGGLPRRWQDNLDRCKRTRAAAAIFTSIRIAAPDGQLDLTFTGPPESAATGFRPWFEASQATAGGTEVLFGHWARLGFMRRSNALCLDSGCVYGGSLTAVQLETGEVVQQPLEAADRCG